MGLGLGLGLGLPISRRGLGALRRLFGGGEAGLWHAASDLSASFQDTAGATPTALEQAIGLVRDKSGRGNDASQSLAASRPVLSARANMATQSHDLSNAAWSRVGLAGVTANAGLDHLGANVAAKLIADTTLGGHFVQQAISGQPDNAIVSAAIYARRTDFDYVRFGLIAKNGSGSSMVYRFSTDQITVATTGTDSSGLTHRAEVQSDGSVRLSIEGVNLASGATTPQMRLTLCDDTGANSFTGDGVKGTLAWGAQWERGAVVGRYQAITTAASYATTGFPVYEWSDGVDDGLTTAGGGGATSAFFLCMGFRTEAAGVAQTLWSDLGTNAGIKLEINASNQLVLTGGNGTALVSTPGIAVSAHIDYVVTARYEAGHLYLQLNGGAEQWQVLPTLAAGTAGITIGKDNGAASGFFRGRLYERAYTHNAAQTAAQRHGAAAEIALPLALTIAAPVDPAAPANAVAPSISGSTTLGGTLTTTNGTWSGVPAPKFAYQWQRFTAGAWADIAGATATTHVTANDGPHRCRVTATNPSGTAQAVFSGEITVGTSAVAPSNTNAPEISGTAYDGNTIYALPGDWSGTSPITYAYQWQVQDAATLAWNDIGGATTASYLLPSAAKYRCRVRASNAASSGVDAFSNVMTVSAKASGLLQAPQRDYVPQLFGTPQTGQVLTSSRGVWFASPEPTYAFLWESWNGTSWVAASGTNNAETYTPAAAGDFRCRVTATNSQGSAVGISAAMTVSGGTTAAGTYSEHQILVDETGDGTEPAIARIEFRATVGGAALTGTPFASSEAGALNTAAKAFDSDANTHWTPALGHAATDALGLRLGTASALAQVAITAANVEAQFAGSAPRTFRIQGWDGAKWTTLRTFTDEPAWTPGLTRTYSI